MLALECPKIKAMTKLACFVLLLTLCSIGGVWSRDPDKLLLVDRLRFEFIKLEEQLWAMVKEAQNGDSDLNEPPEMTLIRKFEDFGNIIKEVCCPS